MNKETIYIEPSEDITDILSRIKASDKKVIALVPPKKPAVLLSSVNIKLISRAAKADKKAIVLVTTDDSLTKLAMTANLPVAPSLKSRPVMPGEENDLKTDKETDDSSAEPDDDEEEKDEGNEFEDDEPESEDSEEDTDENDEDANNEEDEDDEGDDEEDDGGKDEENEDDEEDDEDAEDDSEDDEEEKSEKKEEKKSKKSDKVSAVDEKKSSKKSKKSDKERSSGFAGFLSQRKFWLIGGFVVAICVAAFLVWAFTIAPRVSVSVSVRTSSSNFSENVTFTKNSADEDSSIGSFYLHEEKIEKDQAVKFTATGKKDLGEVASGELVLYAYFLGPGSVKVAAGSTFSHGTLNYTTLTDVTLSGPADTKAKTFNATCDNYSDDFEIGVDYCQVSATVSIKAAAPGEDYNISATNEGWTSSVGNVSAANHDITGGTSRIVTVVQQSDVDLALDKLKSEGSVGSKEELYGKLSDTVMPIEASFKVSTSEPQTVPGVGQEVEEGVTPQVSTKTVYSVYTIDRVRMEEFIKAKATVDEGKRLYSYGEPFIEYYAESSKDVYTAKLKTTYKVGPEISETEVLDKIRGEKIGRIEPILKDAFSGVSSVKFEKSYFWVNSIPNDENKVEIKLTIEGEDEK